MREAIAKALNDYCTRWCKREHAESNALNNWKLNIFHIIDKRISFYLNNLDRLPPKLKFSFRHLKQGIREFHRMYVWFLQIKPPLHYINTLVQELGSTETYEHTSTDEKSIVDNHCCHIITEWAVGISENQEKLLTFR